MPSTAPPAVSSFKKSRVPPSRPASPPHSRRIADLPPAEQEARYSALSQRYGVPAFRPGQSLSEAVCFKCHEKGHLASKCPTKQDTVTQQPATASTSLNAAAPALHTSSLDDVHGSHLECSFFTADIALLGPYDAFPDTGSKITIVTKSAIKNLPLMPWTREPLTVVGGSSVHPEGTVCLKITVGPITALVEAAVISNNVLPVILGEDWFRASNTRLVFEPPNPAEIHHLASGTVIHAHQKLYPHASCTVIPRQSFLAQCTEVPCSGGLQEAPLPGMQPLWKPLCKSLPEQATVAPEGTVAITIHPDRPPAFVAKDLSEMQQVALSTTLSDHLTFARDEDDISHFQGVEHCIDLVPDAVPYSQSLCRLAYIFAFLVLYFFFFFSSCVSSNSSLLSVFRKASPENQSCVTKLEEAAFAVNTTLNTSTGFSPFELLFGYIPRLPAERYWPVSNSSLTERLLDVQAHRTEAMANCEEAQDRRKLIYDRMHRPHTFSIGDFVWVRRQQPVLQGLEKLSPRFRGIYRLAERLTPATFRAIQVSSPSTRHSAQPKTVHVSQLKRYVPPLPVKCLEDTASTLSSSSEQDSPSCPQQCEPPSLQQSTSSVSRSSETASALPLNAQRPVRQRRPPTHLQDYEVDF
ncbi:hypothetical protein HPB49_016690 [Dermacentor silvarum]|uniref:Uncharacterized protein n=1 Tax=Dermacentor silvarum TaxID=543639 RepID=A0ACB8DET0_DERSI|nr:hypothetical protein HPB49_016690 [Dermacentor silvarum]